jgi:hypothetical protein
LISGNRYKNFFHTAASQELGIYKGLVRVVKIILLYKGFI